MLNRGCDDSANIDSGTTIDFLLIAKAGCTRFLASVRLRDLIPFEPSAGQSWTLAALIRSAEAYGAPCEIIGAFLSVETYTRLRFKARYRPPT